jgi:hypothetical protein
MVSSSGVKMMIWTCKTYIQSPHTNTGTGVLSDCCKTCGRTKEAHEIYNKYMNEKIIIWNGRKYTFKDAEDMIKNRFFPS